MRKLVFLGLVLMAGMSAFAEQPKSHWAKFGEDKIRYYDVGDRSKDALVFVHCWTCNADFWKDSISAFPKYRVIAMDLVGHGQSDKPKAEYSMEYFARSVAAVLEKAGVRRAVLVGHSMGTPVIRQFYRLYPEKTIALVVVDGALRPFGPRTGRRSIGFIPDS
jgi:pimeloyl-ACP methyl ester carboxylesterase